MNRPERERGGVSCRPQLELVHVHFPAAEEVGAVHQVFHVRLEVSLTRDRDRLLPVRLEVRGPGGAPKPDAKQSAIRNSWTLLSIIPFVGWLLGLGACIWIAVTINSSPTKQGKHDELAGGTQVIKV